MKPQKKVTRQDKLQTTEVEKMGEKMTVSVVSKQFSAVWHGILETSSVLKHWFSPYYA